MPFASSLSDLVSPFLWFSLDLLWLVIGIVLAIRIISKATITFLVASSLSALISLLNMLDVYAYTWGRGELISYDEDWHFFIFDFGWAAIYLIMILSIAFIVFKIGALTKRNRELETILSSQNTPANSQELS